MSRWWWEGLGDLLATAVGEPGGLSVEWAGGFLEIGAVGASEAVLPGANGMTILADLDGDGVVDHVSMHRFDGRFEVWSAVAGGADWGLSGDGSAEVRREWGLPADNAPGRGWEVPDTSYLESRWMRVDRG